MQTRNICKNCGGELERIGSFNVCPYCDAKWTIITEDAAQVKLQNAYDALRQSDFDRAVESFEDIIISEPKNYEALWGKALAENGIIFVNDLNENKKVPTFNNISENSFTDNSSFKKAVSFAPQEIADNYKNLAEKIEKIRIEWLEKAKKEPPYDIFICFKDSDKENGIERTQDSYAAQELYTGLVSEGYRVFFSRVSLRDKISEQYEPYIYNALNTAKVMIVYGEKPEYFSSTWLKNEWNRFRKKIEEGKKHKSSLIVVCKNMNANELPIALKTRQCMNASDITFYSDLTKHIKRVIEEVNQSIHVERIEITGGQISKKASKISTNTIKTREIGEASNNKIDISEKQSVNLIHTYLKMRNWNEANSLIETVLFENPACAEAMWCKILANHKTEDNDKLCEALKQRKNFNDSELLIKLLNCASKEYATDILNLLYEIDYIYDSMFAFMLRCILSYSYSKRSRNIAKSFDKAIERLQSASFDTLIATINSDEVDEYISYNIKYANALLGHGESNEAEKYINNVLAVDEGNLDALRLKINSYVFEESDIDTMITSLETLLKYTNDNDNEVLISAMNFQSMPTYLLRSNHISFMKELLKYYRGNLSDLKNILLNFSKTLLTTQYKKEALYFYDIILSFDKNCADAYWGICLIKIGAEDDSDIKNSSTPIKKCPEFNKYLTLVSEKRQQECIMLANEQPKKINEKIKSKKQKVNELEKQKSELLEEKKDKKTDNRSSYIIALIYYALYTAFTAFITYSITLFLYADINIFCYMFDFLFEDKDKFVAHLLLTWIVLNILSSILYYISNIFMNDAAFTAEADTYFKFSVLNIITLGIFVYITSILTIKKHQKMLLEYDTLIADKENEIQETHRIIQELQEQLKDFN